MCKHPATAKTEVCGEVICGACYAEALAEKRPVTERPAAPIDLRHGLFGHNVHPRRA